MKRYTIKINKNNNNNNFSFRTNNDPSEALDNLIFSNLKKMNPYLYDTDTKYDIDDHIIIPNRNDNGYLLKGFSTEFAKAAKFLSDYTPTKKYYTYDKTPIEFFEDEIQIGNILIPLYKLSNSKYYDTFDTKTKNIIINLFITINR